MAKIQNLLTSASVIRDATTEGENTALRVGSMFVNLIQAIVDVLPTEILDASGISSSSTESNFVIRIGSIDNDGSSSKKEIIIPAASSANAGVLTPSKLKEINSALETISGAVTNASDALTAAGNASDAAKSAVATAQTASDTVSAFTTKITTMIGAANGIAPLDENAQIPAEYLTDALSDVEENLKVISKMITDLSSDVATQSANVGILPFQGLVYHADEAKSAEVGSIVWCVGDHKFVSVQADGSIGDAPSIYHRMNDAGEIVGPANDVLYRCDSQLYRTVGETLEQYLSLSSLPFGSDENEIYEGSKGAALEDKVSTMQARSLRIVPFSGFYPLGVHITPPMSGVYYVASGTGSWRFGATALIDGYTESDYYVDPDATTLEVRSDTIFMYQATLYRYEDGELVEVGGDAGSATGNIINVNEIEPLESGYYTRAKASAAVPEDLRTAGRKITFMSAAGVWQTWQFTGSSVDDWQEENYWAPDVKGISFNGAEASTPDRDGIVNLNYKVDVDDQLNGDSANPIANSAVSAELDQIRGEIPVQLSIDSATRQLSLLDQTGGAVSTVTLPDTGSSGTTNPTAVEISVNTPMIDYLKEGENYTVEVTWRHYNISTGVDTQYGGRAEILVGGSTVASFDITQGICQFSIDSKYLSVGTNSVRVRITADDGAVASSAYIKLTVVTLAISTSYAISTITQRGNSVAFRYVVTGSGTKIVKFTLDGNELSSESITTSGATSVKTISTSDLSHGAHRLVVQAERELTGGTILESNVIALDLMVVEDGNESTIIAVDAQTSEVAQYSTVQIPFAVYNPTAQGGEKSTVVIKMDGAVVQTSTVDAVKHVFSRRVKQYGTVIFEFSSNGTTKSVEINVIPASTQINAETDALALYLTSSGRSNDADDAQDWSFEAEDGTVTKAEFTDCGFDDQSGWIEDSDGLTALHLEKGAKCIIPYKPFATDCKLNGKTIEVEFMVSNCYDTDATLISCFSGNVGFEIKAQEAYFQSALKQQVSTKFKQDERIRVGFTLESTSSASSKRLMYIFVNGIMSGVVQYDTSDYFVQNNPVGISLGHSACELDVYNIRIYDNTLSFKQMVNNYIADIDDTTKMFEKLEANDILNDDASETDIDYEKAVAKIPCMTIIGELPTYKGDKKANTKIVYEDKQYPEYSFTLAKATNNVQGTSSQYYPRKNFKFKATAPFVMTQTGAEQSKYALRGVDANGNEVAMKAVKTFCLKADFAESSGTHNTGAANMIHEVLTNSGIITPMQQVDSTCRTTVYGFPILLFWQADETSARQFVGKYNFNNDKSTQDTYGFENISGYNKGMVNRDDYLVYEASLATLQSDDTVDKDSQYLIETTTADPMNNHLVTFDSVAGAWQDKGEMWRWDADNLCWCKNDGTTETRSGILARVEDGELVENNIECWEFTNNGHPMCLLQISDFTSKIYGDDIPDWLDANDLLSDDNGKYAKYWTGAFEPRYPDNDDNNRQYARGKVPKQLKRIMDWIAGLSLTNEDLTDEQKKNLGQRFATDLDKYFNRKFMLGYDIIRELFVAVDQGAKNMMWLIIDGIVYCIFYDNDTIWLLNNEGRLSFVPYVEPHSKDSLGKFVFNGESSTLWNLVEIALEDEKNNLYNTMVSQGGLTYERACIWFNDRQSSQWCETVYNADSKYKYIDSFGSAGQENGEAQNYLDIAQGSREAHRKWAMYERFQYINAKRCTGTYRDSYVYLRSNTNGDSSVASKVEVTVTAAQDWYYGFRFSGNAGFSSRFIAKGESYTFTAPTGSKPNDTETYIHQADRISDLGDLSVLYPTSLQVTKCKMLTRLVVGNSTEGYIGKLANLTLGTHPLMKYINVVNCGTLQSSLDVQGCSALEEIEAQGSNITSVTLPTGSSIAKMHLPESVVQLQFVRLPNLTNDNLIVDGYENIQTINIQDCSKLNPMPIVEAVASTPGNKLQYLRVTGVTMKGSGEELDLIISLGVKGAEDRTGKPEVVGNYQLTKLPESGFVDKVYENINGITIVLIIDAFIDAINEVNGEIYSGEVEDMDEVTIDNVSDHIIYYNGETADEAVAREAQENRSISELLLQ
jgi:hypothetical protein